MRRLLLLIGLTFTGVTGISHAQLSPEDLITERPMIMPAAGQPGPATWMMGQAYGNTTGAYNFGDRWYRAGQGLHFGLDLAMPCGTPLVAVADGTVMFVDEKSFGSDPHNLILRHDELNLTTLYGHLLEPPVLMPGQFVQKGDVIAKSGDPDVTCVGRPHLHFEVRSLDYSRTVNPVSLIEANWHSLALFGPYGYPLFQQDLMNPRRWVTLDDQPDVSFWGAILNQYSYAYPLPGEAEPAPFPIPERHAPEVLDTAVYTTRKLTDDGCCANVQWHPTDENTYYVMDGPPGSLASVFERNTASDVNTLMQPAPMPHLSANGAFEVLPFVNGHSKIRRVTDGTEYTVFTDERLPTLNPASTRLLWTVNSDVVVPGQSRPNTEVYISDINGENARVVFEEPGASAMWMNDDHILITMRDEQRNTSLFVYTLETGEVAEIGTWFEMREVHVAPGGQYVAMFLRWQPDPSANGIYVLDLASPRNPTIAKMPWLGAYRWRDADSLYYIPYEPATSLHSLRLYNVLTQQDSLMAAPQFAPFAIAEGHWVVSADGARILFQDATDGRNLYVLEPDL